MFKLNNVTRKFKNKEEIIALNNFSYTFKNHGFYVVAGPSGSGKSTLLFILACLDDNYEGKISYCNKDIAKFSYNKKGKFRKNEMGMIYQNSYLIPYLKVKDNISLNNKLINKDLITKLGINRLMNRDITKLSGGQKQRVSLARALINNKKVILADEPTGALDQNNAQKVMGILKNVAKNKLVIMVSHDVSLCKKYADVILYLKEGKLEKEEVINNINNLSIKKEKNKKVKKNILKLVFSFFYYKKRRLLTTSFCCSLGLIGMLLSLILTQGFTSFFNKQFENSLNSNIIYGYPDIKESVNTISLFEIQSLASSYNLDWAILYLSNEDIVSDVKYQENNVEWLSFDNILGYSISCDYKVNTNEFILNFPSNYFSVFSFLFEESFISQRGVEEYIENNDVYFTFTFIIDNTSYVLDLKLGNIIWNYNDKIEILHSSKFWVEELQNDCNFTISDDIDSTIIIRYPCLLNVSEEIKQEILLSQLYQHIIFEFDVSYRKNKITLCYYGTSSRISKEYLENYLKYDGVIDYLYLSSNGISIDQTFPNLKFNEIKGRDISFYPISLNEEKVNEQFIFEGSIPKNNCEIIVSLSLLKELNIKINDDILIDYCNKKTTKVKVVGYIEGNSALLVYHKGSWSYDFFIKELEVSINDLPCYQIALIMDNSQMIPSFVSFFNSLNQKITFISPLYDAQKEVSNILKYFELGLLVLSIFSIIVSLLLIGIIIFINTIEQKKYDAILLMQGYKQKDIIKLHIFQNLLICFISYLITFFTSFFIVFEVNSVFSLMIGVSYYSFASLSIDILIKILFFIILIGLVFSYIPLTFLSLKNPLKILKE